MPGTSTQQQTHRTSRNTAGTVPRGFQLQIDAPATIHFTTDGSDPRLSGGDINPLATSAEPAATITLNESLTLKARTRSGSGEWSALTAATFTISATDLRITEIMYNPAVEPLAEFLEITNSGDFTVSLTGLHFTAGISFDFDTDSSIASLPPGARLLLVRDLDAFRAVHGAAHDALIAGTFQNGSALANGGETLTIADAGEEIVLTLTYSDDAPWPPSADGGGRSLVWTGGDRSLAQSWRPSSAAGGNPGGSDATPYSGGSPLDYALAGPVTITPTPSAATLTYTVYLGADSATISVQHSPDLKTWTTLTDPILEQQLVLESNSRAITVGLPDGESGFARLQVDTVGE